MHRIKKQMNWSGPDGSTHDLVGKSIDIEVKSTIKRYGKKVLVSGEHQLATAEGKRLFLAFMRFEVSDGGESINTLISELIALGANARDIEKDLSGMGYQSGKSTRAETYMLHDSEIYEVTNVFPKIIPSSFLTGIIPAGIEQIKYEVDLSIVAAFSSLDDFNP
jgi:hypothetical protein